MIEAVGDVVHAGAAVALQVRAEHAELAHARDELARELLAAEAALEQRQAFVLDEGADGVAGDALFVGEERVELVVVRRRAWARMLLPAAGRLKQRAPPGWSAVARSRMRFASSDGRAAISRR